jgi:hypothetical protein
MGLRQKIYIALGACGVALCCSCRQPQKVDVQPTPLPVQIAATTQPVEFHVEPIEFKDKSPIIRLEPTTQNIHMDTPSLKVEPILVRMETEKELTPTTQPGIPSPRLAAFLDEHLIWILGTLLGIAGYLRAQAGRIAGSRAKLIRQARKLTAQDPMRKEKQSQLNRRWFRYLGMCCGEFVVLALVALLACRVVWHEGEIDQFAQWAFLIVPVILTVLHLLLWIQGLFVEPWSAG